MPETKALDRKTKLLKLETLLKKRYYERQNN
jgi:hypothetical protein